MTRSKKRLPGEPLLPPVSFRLRGRGEPRRTHAFLRRRLTAPFNRLPLEAAPDWRPTRPARSRGCTATWRGMSHPWRSGSEKQRGARAGPSRELGPQRPPARNGSSRHVGGGAERRRLPPLAPWRACAVARAGFTCCSAPGGHGCAAELRRAPAGAVPAPPPAPPPARRRHRPPAAARQVRLHAAGPQAGR